MKYLISILILLSLSGCITRSADRVPVIFDNTISDAEWESWEGWEAAWKPKEGKGDE